MFWWFSSYTLDYSHCDLKRSLIIWLITKWWLDIEFVCASTSLSGLINPYIKYEIVLIWIQNFLISTKERYRTCDCTYFKNLWSNLQKPMINLIYFNDYWSRRYAFPSSDFRLLESKQFSEHLYLNISMILSSKKMLLKMHILFNYIIIYKCALHTPQS